MTVMPQSNLAYAFLIAAIVGFVVLAAFAAAADRFEGDLWLTQQLQTIDSAAVENVFDWTEDLSDDPIVLPIWIASGLAFFLLGGLQPALLFALGGAGRSFVPLLKDIIDRPRPSPDLVDFTEQSTSMSFPSGHGTTVIVLFGLVFYFSGVYIRHVPVRRAVQAACVWMVVVVGIERVYAGQHWPSDVLGGFWFGGLILAAAILLHRRFGLRHTAK